MASASSAVDIGFVPQGHHSKEKAKEWATKSHTHTHRGKNTSLIKYTKKYYESQESHRKVVTTKKETNGEQYENINVS